MNEHSNVDLRIVSWNCCGDLPSKIEHLLKLKPNIAVIPESPGGDNFAELAASVGASAASKGPNPKRSLGVMAWSPWEFEGVDDQQVAGTLSVQVHGPASFLLIAVWTVVRSGSLTYAQQAAHAIDVYREKITAEPTVMVGDFNRSGQTSDASERRRHIENVRQLSELNLRSAYHEANGVQPGDEVDGTLYYQRRETSSFHCDLCFVPAAWAQSGLRAVVGTYNEWVSTGRSDHVPVIVDIKLPRTA